MTVVALASDLLSALPATASPRLRSELARFIRHQDQLKLETEARMRDNIPREYRPQAINAMDVLGAIFKGTPMGDDMQEMAGHCMETMRGDAKILGEDDPFISLGVDDPFSLDGHSRAVTDHD